MAGEAIDQEARDLIREIGAMIRQHIAVCDERENRRVKVEIEKDKRLDQFLANLKSEVAGVRAGYDAAYGDISGRLNTDVNSLVDSIQAIDKKVVDHEKQTHDKIEAVEARYGGRFWTLAVTMILGLVAVIWSIVAHKMGLG